jgi:hypothetical protein
MIPLFAAVSLVPVVAPQSTVTLPHAGVDLDAQSTVPTEVEFVGLAKTFFFTQCPHGNMFLL